MDKEKMITQKLLKALQQVTAGVSKKTYDVKGPQWVKPTLENFIQELEDEEDLLFGDFSTSEFLELYKNTTVKEFTPEALKLMVTDSIDNEKLDDWKLPPKEWFFNPSSVPKNFRNDHETKFDLQHFQNVIPIFIEGRNLDMPILCEGGNNQYEILGGRRRIAYSLVFDIPVRAMIFKYKDIQKLSKASCRMVEAHKAIAVKLGDSKQEIIDNLEKNHAVFLTLTDKGNIFLSINAPDDEKTKCRITLVKENSEKIIQIDDNKTAYPETQKLLKALIANGIIDKSWKVRQSNFSRHYDSPEFEFYFFLDPRNTLTRSFNSSLTLYHGTSSEDWEKIKKTGLVPLFYGSNTEHGFESRYKHAGNEKVLYLAKTLNDAYNYGKTRCNSLKNKAKRAGEKKLWDERSGDGFWLNDKLVSIVVLEVTIPDISKLVADDDYINELARDAADQIWENKPDNEKEIIVEKLKKKHADIDSKWNGWRDPTHQVMLWRETDEGFAEIMKHVPKKHYQEWFESIKQKKQVGYKGIIPPKFLKEVDKKPTTERY
jgi:hypothetical protein